MDVLLVEDDEFKASDVAKVLAETVPDANLQRAMSVTTALKAINRSAYSLIVLDMSLPTFDLSGPGGGGSPQGQGGLEVLRLARRLGNPSPFVIMTQYPDIEIDRRDVPLSMASRTLRDHFRLDIRACLLYEFDGDAWRAPFRECVADAMGRI
jgi:CheY-like chemotaxis protein